MIKKNFLVYGTAYVRARSVYEAAKKLDNFISVNSGYIIVGKSSCIGTTVGDIPPHAQYVVNPCMTIYQEKLEPNLFHLSDDGLFQIELPLHATIVANEDCSFPSILQDDIEAGENYYVSAARFNDPKLPEVSFSPLMCIHKALED